MDQRLSVVTLGVEDMARARGFYEALGWRAHPSSQDAVTFFQLPGMVISLFSREALAADATVQPTPSGGFSGVALALNVPDKADVSPVLEAAAQAGGRIVKPAEDVFWGGHSGYFADTEGHLWEVAWNPFWALGPDGAVDLGADDA